MKAKLKPLEVEYVQWKDNLAEMKMFCLEDCKITYEYAPGLDCYYNLVVVNDQQRWVTVPLNSYVVKLADRFIVVSDIDFKEYFDV